jgi:hypothetical protein
MPSPRFVPGRMRQGSTPDWRPLEHLLGADELCAHFMWMFDVELDDGTVLNAYKHKWTRCYFHLSDDARTFYFAGDELYGVIDPHTAIKAVFERWDCCKPTHSEKAALRDVLRRVGGSRT